MLGLKRSSFYYTASKAIDETNIMNVIANIHAKWPYYGYRKIMHELKTTYEMKINHKHVLKLMNEMGLKCIYPGPKTSAPGFNEMIFPYLLKDLVINKPNQVWSVDITYIRLPVGMVYLFALIDWYSRYIVGWTLATTMEVCHAISTFEMASSLGLPKIANMDQGSQFTGKIWVEHLQRFEVSISHTGVGRCIDNVRIERFWKSLKYEDIYLRHYESVKEARIGIGEYIEHYNNRRPHQALFYATPSEMYFKTA